jgi:hypothetical protein
MPEQPTLSVAEQEGMIDQAILGLLVNTNEQRVWSFEEIEREMGYNPIDSLNRLYGGGLVHRLDKQFFWATRAALMSDEISM